MRGFLKSKPLCVLLLLLCQKAIGSFISCGRIFHQYRTEQEHRNLSSIKMSSDNRSCPHPFSLLPGDPSLILTTNLNLGDKKLDIMKGISKVMADATGKPEAYIAVSIIDNTALIFGGTNEPAALANMMSIGAISMENNGAVTKGVTKLLEPFGLDAARIYINFFDVPRANVGWSKKTFAG